MTVISIDREFGNPRFLPTRIPARKPLGLG
jgi:hypothetical protein